MVVSLEKPAATSLSALRYSERKVEAGTAEIVGHANLESLDPVSIRTTMERYEHWSKRVSALSFHASVNPSDEDPCSREQVMAFIHDMMAELGYSDQPYVIYRHFDIEREHFHVVSVRSDRNGNKIRDYYERRRVEMIMRRKGERYGFAVGREGGFEREASLSRDLKAETHQESGRVHGRKI